MVNFQLNRIFFRTNYFQQLIWRKMTKIQINKPAPDFSGIDYLGNQIGLGDYFHKKNVLLVFNRGFV
jgi:hypothetical protein